DRFALSGLVAAQDAAAVADGSPVRLGVEGVEITPLASGVLSQKLSGAVRGSSKGIQCSRRGNDFSQAEQRHGSPRLRAADRATMATRRSNRRLGIRATIHFLLRLAVQTKPMNSPVAG